jgi:excinuclease ABC subunit C
MLPLGCDTRMPVDASRLHLPTEPGVYLFKQGDGKVLYVGKATNLRDRVRSYFANDPDRAMIPTLVRKSDDVDCIVTKNPTEALLLERQLIREHKPRYNSLLKDDKSYPFIAITDEEIPRILYTRHPPENARLWGPFPDAGAAKRVIKLLRRHFGVRDCKELLPQGCLAMHIGLCTAPCIDASGYEESVNAAIGVLDGDGEALIEALQGEMDAYSKAMHYEQAGRSRDLIVSVRRTLGQQVIHSRFYQECDAIGFADSGEMGCVVVLSAEQGMVQGQVQYPLLHRGDVAESVSRVLFEHYEGRRPPKKVLVPTELGEWLGSWLSERRGSKVEVRVPQRGVLASLRNMADANAKALAQRNQKQQSGSLEQRAADDGATLLSVESLDHIVCFDMAQLQGEGKVGACISLRSGRPEKKEYRTYTVKSEAADDVRMMCEVVERWLRRQEEWPDLLLIDGGEVHLAGIAKLIESHGLTDRIPLAALAKREETLHRPDNDDIILDRRGRVLVFARDEAHRFVNNFHRKRRSKKSLADPLEGVDGLGAKKLQALLRHFGGRRGIEHAGLPELRTVNGIGPALAERIWDSLH